MQRKLAIRFIIGILAICGLFLGSGLLKEFFKDPGKHELNSEGLVLAIENLPKGQRAVFFKPNGEKVESSGYKDGIQDQGVSWAPDGNRAYVSSNREASSFNIYAWDTDANALELRSRGGRSQGVPWYGPSDAKRLDRSGLILSGGFVMEFDVTDQTTRQILPPVTKDRSGSEDGGGAGSSMEALYSAIGTSFKQAFWSANRESIFAVMRREEGEVAVYNPIVFPADGQPHLPRRIFGGKEVQADANGQGVAVFVIRNFQFGSPDEEEAFHKTSPGKQPFTHAILKISVQNGQPAIEPVVLVPAQQVTFMDPAISPDGKGLAIIVGQPGKDGTGMVPQGLYVMPFERGGGSKPVGIIQGDISQPSWSPDGKRLVFIKREDGQSAVYTINLDGTGVKKLSTTGDYSSPKFSPKLAKSSS